IDAGNASAVIQSGVTVTGGTINTTGTGVYIATNNGNNFLSGATLNGRMDLATGTSIERVTNGLTLTSGSFINVNNNSILSFQGDQTLGGTGTIVFGNTGSSNRVGIDGTSTLSIGSNVVIRGENGTVGAVVFAGGSTTIANAGRISADVSGGLIDLSATQTNNTGTL